LFSRFGDGIGKRGGGTLCDGREKTGAGGVGSIYKRSGSLVFKINIVTQEEGDGKIRIWEVEIKAIHDVWS